MQTRFKLGALALAASVAATAIIAACGSDSKDSTVTPTPPPPPPPPPPPSITYIAPMSGANEVPVVAGNAVGTATFTLTGKTLTYVVTVSGLSGNAAASHIHVGAANANGNIVFPFNAAAVQSGQVASGTVDLTQPVSNGTTMISGDSLLTLLNSGQLYTNVHTAAWPAGEIRGQITRVP